MLRRLINLIFNIKPHVEIERPKAFDTASVVFQTEPIVTKSPAKTEDKPLDIDVDSSALFYSLLFPLNNKDHAGAANNLERSVLAQVYAAFKDPREIAENVLKLPTLISEIDRKMAAEDLDTKALLGLIEQDPLLSIELLSLCNSTTFRRSEKEITSLQQAVVQLGRNQLQRFVRVCLFKQIMDIKPIYYKSFGADIWRHSMQVAYVATKLFDGDSDTIFMLGLLHDVGKIAIFKMLLDGFLQVEPGERPNSSFFRKVMTTKSLHLSALLVKHWQLPSEFEVPLVQLAETSQRPNSDMALVVWQANIISECSMLKQKGLLSDEALVPLLQHVEIDKSLFDELDQKLITF